MEGGEEGPGWCHSRHLHLQLCKCNSLFKAKWGSGSPDLCPRPTVGWFVQHRAPYHGSHCRHGPAAPAAVRALRAEALAAVLCPCCVWSLRDVLCCSILPWLLLLQCAPIGRSCLRVLSGLTVHHGFPSSLLPQPELLFKPPQ